jgi:hypothetical protein
MVIIQEQEYWYFKMKIYDCSLFRNELDLLELRLRELYDHVDHFVIVEATHTFQCEPKELVLKNNWDRFKQWHDKIIHVVVDDMPNTGDAWVNDYWQRNAIARGLVNADDNDLVIICDGDEILRPEIVDNMRANPRDLYGFRTPYFNFKFNYMLVDNHESYCVWITAGRKKFIGQPENFRAQRFQLTNLDFDYDDGRVKMYEHAGWHFTYMGDTEWIKAKLKSFAHTELNKEEVLAKINVEDMMNRGVGFNPLDSRPFVKVALDEYFPKTILENKEKYKNYIVEGDLDSINEYM